MAPKPEHPNKGWAAAYGRVSLIRAGTDPDSPETKTASTAKRRFSSG
jgi:hypothetical protein